MTVSVDGATGRVRGYGDLLVVSLPGLRTARQVGSALALLDDVTRRSLTDAVARAGVAVDVRVGETSVATYRPGRDGAALTDLAGRWLARLFGTAPAHPSLGGILRAAIRRR